jgi:hypothetical protein
VPGGEWIDHGEFPEAPAGIPGTPTRSRLSLGSLGGNGASMREERSGNRNRNGGPAGIRAVPGHEAGVPDCCGWSDETPRSEPGRAQGVVPDRLGARAGTGAPGFIPGRRGTRPSGRQSGLHDASVSSRSGAGLALR